MTTGGESGSVGGAVDWRGGSSRLYLPYLLLISGLGGLLAGVDFGIIGSALDFLNKTINVTEAQLSFIVAIYIGGGFVASLFAGILADGLGRKRMMIGGGLMFVASILLIYLSQGFVPLLLGRILMGLSGGIICVVVPLYMAECLPSAIRGRGTAIFQFMLTLGMVAAGGIGVYFTRHNAAVIAAAQEAFAADPARLKTAILAANNAAWRNMFLVAALPGAIYSLGAFFIRESPRWLFRRTRVEQATAILDLSRSPEQARLEIDEMGRHAAPAPSAAGGAVRDSLLQRKYVIPFVITCVILTCTQATGINSIIAYAVVILKQAGLDAISASWGYTLIMTLNCLMTLVGAALVDRAGRKFLLKTGTLGIIVCLSAAGLTYRGFESRRADVGPQVQALVKDNALSLHIEDLRTAAPSGAPRQLSILYNYGDRQQLARAFMPTPEARAVLEAEKQVLEGMKPEDRAALDAATPLKEKDLETLSAAEKEAVFAGRKLIDALPKADRKTLADAAAIRDAQVLAIAPDPKNVDADGQPFPLEIRRAKYGPIPSKTTGWLITVFLCLSVSFFSLGPGVCVWLALTELMPTRIRSTGMGIAMVMNNGIQFLIALFFLPVVGNYGFHAMFFFWVGCTVIYFITAAFFMPETKGKTLEEIEDYFEGKGRRT